MLMFAQAAAPLVAIQSFDKKVLSCCFIFYLYCLALQPDVSGCLWRFSSVTDPRVSSKLSNGSVVSQFPHIHKFAISVVGGRQSRSLRRPQPARLLRIRKPEGHAAGQTALPLAAAHHVHTSIQRRVHLMRNHCETTHTELCLCRRGDISINMLGLSAAHHQPSLSLFTFLQTS